MDETTYTTSNRTKYILVAIAVVLAFFAAYGIASGRTANAGDVSTTATAQSVSGSGGSAACDPAAVGASECGGDCCGEGSSTAAIEGATTLDGDVQRIAVDVSAGYFDPNVIRVQAGVPVEITFGEGSGCMAEVMFKDFGVFEDLTNGGAVVQLPALDPGEYGFSCGMEMVFGVVIAE